MTPQPPRVRMLMVGPAYVAENAVVTGDVVLGEDVNVWYGVVVRGDDAKISIGARTNLQDGVICHADPGVENRIGSDVTIGHGAICHGARIDDFALVGMGAILLGGSTVGEGALVGAGALVPEGMQVEPYSLVVGVPARVVRTFDRDTREREAISHAAGYVTRAREHADGVWTGRVVAQVRPTSR